MYDQAQDALFVAAMRDPEAPGTPHDGSFEAMVRVYETLAARALANGGTDPFEEAHRAGTNNYLQLKSALRSIYSVRPHTEGGDYLLELFEATEPPEPYTHNDTVRLVWCEVGELLRPTSRVRQFPDGRLEEVPVDPTQPGRMSELPEIAQDPREFLSRCNRVGNLRRVRN